ncbi:hypothetical protein D3C80_1813720 [compost metagenome]
MIIHITAVITIYIRMRIIVRCHVYIAAWESIILHFGVVNAVYLQLFDLPIRIIPRIQVEDV